MYNDKELQHMHNMERAGALMCVALLMLSMVVVILSVALWLVIGW